MTNKILRILMSAMLVFAATPVTVMAQVQQNVLTAVDTCSTLPVSQNNSGAVVQLAGTFVGTLTFEATADGGNWVAISGTPIGGGAAVTSSTTAGAWQFGTSGLISLRACVSAYTSGAVSVTVRATVGSPPTSVTALTPVGTQDTNIIQVGGTTVTSPLPVLINGVSSTACPTTLPCNVNMSQFGGTSTTLGQKAMSASMPVVLSSDQSNVPINILALGTMAQGNITSSDNGGPAISIALIAGTASQYLYITSCSFSNDHASVNTIMYLRDSSTTNTIWAGLVPFGGGNNPVFPTPLKVPTIAAGVSYSNATAGASTYASCNGFKSTNSY